MTPEEQLTDYYVALQTQVELLAEKLRTMEALVSQIVEKSTEWISPKEAMEILGIKHTQLYRIRESSAENPEKGLEARRRASGRWEYSKRSVLRLASYKGGDISVAQISPQQWEEREELKARIRLKRQLSGYSEELINAPIV